MFALDGTSYEITQREEGRRRSARRTAYVGPTATSPGPQAPAWHSTEVGLTVTSVPTRVDPTERGLMMRGSAVEDAAVEAVSPPVGYETTVDRSPR